MNMDLSGAHTKPVDRRSVKTSILLGLMILAIIGQFTILGSLNQLYRKIDGITLYCASVIDEKIYTDQKEIRDLSNSKTK